MNRLTSEQANNLLSPGAAAAGAAVFLVGIGGCGMSALGHLLLDLGFRVIGSDQAGNEDLDRLRARGVEIQVGPHRAETLIAVRPILVAYSSAIPRANPELKEAERLQIPVVRRGVLLAALAHRQQSLCVAGMHGKTTTAALLSFALEGMSTQPSYAIGAQVPQLERAARCSPGTDRYFALEADESDGTLREFHPFGAIVLNLDEEHLDFYQDLEAICVEFRQFASQTTGPLIYCADDERLAEMGAHWPRAVSYGFHALANYRIEWHPAVSGPTRHETKFTVWHRGERLGEFVTALIGEKNVSNAGAVVALLRELGHDVSSIAAAIAPFRGAARRQAELFRDDRFRIVEDYGHHPAEIQATLQACRQLGDRRLLVVFQPHRYTRTQHLLKEFSVSFQGADRLWLTEIYAANEPPIAGISGSVLAEAVRSAGQQTEFVPVLSDLISEVRSGMVPGDLVLFLGAGDITHVAHDLVKRLRRETMSSPEQLGAELRRRVSPETILRADELLAKRTTMRVGGKADFYVEPAGEPDLSEIVRFCAEFSVPFTVIGRGSNLLIRDGGIRGVVIRLEQPSFSRFEITGDRIYCGAGVKLKTLAVEARRGGLAGLEFLEGIPGNVGGALRMNAGAMGSWTFEAVDRVRFMDSTGQIHEKPAVEIHFEYRGCPLFKNHIALGAVFRATKTEPEAIRQRMDSYSSKRWESQPNQPSAGCIFKNPKTIGAGKLIDELGLKGTRVGGALVSDVHGNFIVNDGNATAQDVLSLIAIIQDRVRAARGIELETEVEILGEG